MPRETADPSLSAESLNSGISQGIGLDTLRKVPLNGNRSEKMKEEGKKAEAREKQGREEEKKEKKRKK